MSIPGSASPLFFQAAADAAAAAGPTRSLRFNLGDSAYLNRTPSSASNRRTWTWSSWIKKTINNSSGRYFIWNADTTDQNSSIEYKNDAISVFDYNSGAYQWQLVTSAVLRDNSSWYHVVVAVDTTQSTASDRVKIYINGVEQDSFSTSSYPSQNYESKFNAALEHRVGALNNNSFFLSSYLADIYFIDGSALDATSFGAFDSSGVWQAAAYSGTFGTNGFHLLDFANEATVGHDSSGNNNDFTANNITNETPTTLPAVNFDGNGDYLELADSTDWDFGTGDFTLECYAYFRAITVNSTMINRWGSDAYLWTFQIVDSTENLRFYTNSGNVATSSNSITTGRWYHLAASRTSGTLKLFIDGVEGASSSFTVDLDGTSRLNIGAEVGTAALPVNGLISNVRVIKGTGLYTSNFTPPTSPLSNVTNTKLLCCQSSSSATAKTVGGTISANGDVFATTFTDSSLGQDVLFDVPTNGTQTDSGAGGEVSGNYCCWNPLDSNSNHSLSNGNLDLGGYASAARTNGTISVSSGKWYFEVTNTDGWDYVMVGVGPAGTTGSYPGSDSTSWSFLAEGNKYHNGSGTSVSPAGNSAGDIIGVALDLDNGKIYFSVNGVYVGSGDPAAGSNPAYSSVSGTLTPAIRIWNSGNSNKNISANFGQRAFAYSAPSGYKALCTTNLPTPTIADGSAEFSTTLWTGNGTNGRSITLMDGWDFLWYKQRSSTQYHYLEDKIRGASKSLFSNDTSAESSYDSTKVKTHTSDGITVGTDGAINANGQTYVAWTWNAGSSTVSNTDGSITSSVRANQSAGFSIVTYTGSSSGSTVGHGLNAAPEFIIGKRRDGTSEWSCYHKSLGNNQAIILNTTAAAGGSSTWNSTTPSSSVVTLGSAHSVNFSSYTHVLYCFAPVAGYSAFGSYEGNNNADGPFLNIGFKPAFFLVKNADASQPWNIYDSSRDIDNAVTKGLQPNNNIAEYSTTDRCDFLSNGIKIKSSGGTVPNLSGNTYIYAAFAENPFQANGGLAR